MTSIRQALAAETLATAAREGWSAPSVNITWASKTTETLTVHLEFFGDAGRRHDVEGILAKAFSELYMLQSATAQADWPEVAVKCDVALGDVGLDQPMGLEGPLEPTPDGSRLEHHYSMTPDCKIHGFVIKSEGHVHTWTYVRIMRVGFHDPDMQPVGAFWSQVGAGEDWQLVPTDRYGCNAPDTVAALRDVAEWVLAQRGLSIGPQPLPPSAAHSTESQP